MRPAARIAVVVLSLVAAMGLRPGTPGAVADPHELYKTAEGYLNRGELDEARAVTAQLRATLATTPDWDPAGVYAQELLPALESRLDRIQMVSGRLEELIDNQWTQAQPPESSPDKNIVRAYMDWANSTIDGLRQERARLLEAELTDPQDQAALQQTPVSVRFQEILETGIIFKMSDVAGDVSRRLEEEDERLRILRARLDELKRGAVDLVQDRERLAEELEVSRVRIETYLDALADLVTEGVVPVQDGLDLSAETVGNVFAGLLDEQRETMRAQSSQTPFEIRARRTALARYRHYNRVLTRAGVATDQIDRIDALAGLVEQTPVREERLAGPEASGRGPFLVLSILLLLGGLITLMAVRRSREMAVARGPHRSIRDD
jgi:hypothetical protein